MERYLVFGSLLYLTIICPLAGGSWFLPRKSIAKFKHLTMWQIRGRRKVVQSIAKSRIEAMEGPKSIAKYKHFIMLLTRGRPKVVLYIVKSFFVAIKRVNSIVRSKIVEMKIGPKNAIYIVKY